MFKLKSMVNAPLRIVPYNIFFKEWQSQTRSRALEGTNGLSGYVACPVFYKTAFFKPAKRHSYFFQGAPWWGLAMTACCRFVL